MIAFAISLLLNHPVSAQQGTVVAGGDIISANGLVNFSIGQIDYISFGNSILVSQGMQQAYDKITRFGDDKIGITIWPNPVSNQLHIHVNDQNLSGLSYQLYTSDRKLLEWNIVKNNQTSINMQKYAAAVYILLITHINNKVIAFKIIKN